MELLLSWAVFPLVLLLLCAGSGLAVEALATTRLPGPLLPAIGFAAVVVVGQFLTLADGTAELVVPVAVVLAVSGFGLAGLGSRPLRPPPALVIASAATFAVYALPVVASGEPTIAGFIRLDDTATWLAFTDHVIEHGRDLTMLAPSTHEATLAVNVGEGYPVGAFIPLGIGSRLVGLDPAFAIQPYLAVLALVLAFTIWTLVGALVRSRAGCAAFTFIAAQPAVLYGYYLWGGIKEVAAAALIATTAALGASAVSSAQDWRPLAALALVCSALLGVLSAGGAVWLAPVLLATLVLVGRKLPRRALGARAGGFALGVSFASLPVLLPGGLLPPTSSLLDDPDARGNLFEPLDPLQVAGIWPVGDFRLPPTIEPVSYGLIALALACAALGLAEVFRRRGIGILLLAAGAGIGGLVLLMAGSPWVDGKALAIASPAALVLALVGTAALARSARWLGIGAALALAGGVLWSNALAYRDVNLAPYEQFTELEEIGVEIAGEGPTLMTEYSPYGARHFLRDGDPEAASELRRRTIPRLDGGTVEKGLAADTDELDPSALATYRTLVLRRSPGQSRPPGAYELVRSGNFYEVWQRPEGQVTLAPRLSLGVLHDPLARPSCREVSELAERGTTLVAATRPAPGVIPTPATEHPPDWASRSPGETLTPDGAGTVTARVTAREAGEYEVWLMGSVRPEVELLVDGEPVGGVRHELNNEGQYVSFGPVALARGLHHVEFRFGGADLHPGSGGRSTPIGPIVLSIAEAADTDLVTVPTEDARELCGEQWDWIEAR